MKPLPLLLIGGLVFAASDWDGRARADFDLLLRGDLGKLTAQFDPAMQAALPPEALRTNVRANLEGLGTLKKMGTADVQTIQSQTIVLLPVEFDKQSARVQFTYNADGKIAGLWLRPAKNDPSFQWNTPAYSRREDFKERPIAFGPEGWRLPGTLTAPAGKGPFPAVVLVHGSGPHDRDETLGPNKPLRDLAEGLSSSGIVVLRYDKRTHVYGPKIPRDITVNEEVIEDAAAAVAFVSSQSEVDPKRVYVAGHSFGGHLAPRIAQRVPDIRGVVILAGNVRPLDDLVRDQAPIVAPGIDPAELIKKIRSSASENYWNDLAAYSPTATAAALKVPMLVLAGERDYQVPMTDFHMWQKALSSKKDVTFKSYPGLNHLFISGEGPSTPAEYRIAGNVHPAVVRDIAAFVQAASPLRIGIIGTDTSHVPAFTKLLNDPNSPDYIPGARVVAAFKGGSPDLESSHTRVDKFAEEIRTKYGVEIVPDIPTLLSKVDAVLLESVDGRVHLEQAKPVIAARKPLFIDKPLTSTLEDAREIARLARAAGTPWFSSSSLRYGEIGNTMKFADATGAITWGPGPYDKTHKLDLSWYGIHAVEMLFTLLGPGCEEVVRTTTETSDEVTCRWKDGRVGTTRLVRPYSGYGAVVFRPKQVVQSSPTARASYVPLVREVVKFFQTGKPPVANEETLEIFAFMDAAQRSKESGGKPMKLR